MAENSLARSLARIDTGAEAIRSGASSADTVTQIRLPASAPASSVNAGAKAAGVNRKSPSGRNSTKPIGRK